MYTCVCKQLRLYRVTKIFARSGLDEGGRGKHTYWLSTSFAYSQVDQSTDYDYIKPGKDVTLLSIYSDQPHQAQVFFSFVVVPEAREGRWF